MPIISFSFAINNFHEYNRYYLVISPALSLVLPLLNIPFLYAGHSTDSVLIKSLKVISVAGWEDEFVITAQRDLLVSLLTIQNMALVIYLTGLIVLIVYMGKSINYIKKLSQIYKREQLYNVKFYNTREPGTPFSFFNLLFWNEKILLSSKKGEQILKHELFHIRAGHSYDIIFIKCITIFCWFNPFYHLVMKELRAIHEFLADEYASSSLDKYDYAELLVTEAIDNKNAFLSNQFFNNQIKRRINMITNHNPSSCSTMRRLMALPLLFILFCAFALRTGERYAVSSNFYNKTAGSITVVVDAGHGGIDAGAHSIDGHLEKELTLSIAQKIKNLSGDYNVNVILTRDKDILPGSASNIKDGLINRTSIAGIDKADVFVSIHINASGPNSTASGFNIYVSGQNKQFDKSKLLGSAISGEIRKTYKIAEELNESNSIWVLKTPPVPTVLILCGFLTDNTDLDFITNGQNQEKIAHNILKGIVNYQHSVSATGGQTEKQALTTDTVPAAEIDRIKKRPASSYNVIFTQLEEEASFPGGPGEWSGYMSKTLKYPKEAIDKKIEGTVIVQFIVDKEGNVSKVEAISGPVSGGLRKEAIRVIKNSGKWNPGKQNGLLVKSYKKQPFSFRLN